jgi:hypothetical protein
VEADAAAVAEAAAFAAAANMTEVPLLSTRSICATMGRGTCMIATRRGRARHSLPCCRRRWQAGREVDVAGGAVLRLAGV